MDRFLENIKKFFNDISNNWDLLKWVPENITDFQLFLCSLIVLALVALWCFVDIIGSLFSLYLIKYTDIEKKYPKLKNIIKYYGNINYMYILYQALFLVGVYLILIWTLFSLLYKSF